MHLINLIWKSRCTGYVHDMVAFVFIQILTVHIICDDVFISYQQLRVELKLTQNNTDVS